MAGVKKKSGGRRAGAGRKPKAQEDALTALIDEAWPDAQKLKAFRKHAEQAEDGDVKSFLALLNYRYGKPTERHDLTSNGESLTFTVNLNGNGNG